MRNKYLSIIFICLLLADLGFAQKTCGTFEGSFEEDKQKYPEFYESLEGVNAELEQKHKSALRKMSNIKSENGKKIIPVVVHVIHDFGGENLSVAEIQTALDALNRNINGQSEEFLASHGGNPKTPDVFAAVRGDLNVEFRLAKLDPNGDPTTGVNRIQSHLTELPEPHNQIKAVSYWNSYQYFNLWVVRKFTDNPGLQGYAQFPWRNSMSTDGVVVKYGAIDEKDHTTLTHEVGHWLGLSHTWGDAPCGDDNISDTPPQKYDNNGASTSSPTPPGHPRGNPLTFPYHVGVPSGLIEGCLADSLNWAGEMFNNYMSYTDDIFCTMFTVGQDKVMNETLEGLEGEVGYRQYLWSDENILKTGTGDGYMTPTCTKQPDFQIMAPSTSPMCLGAPIPYHMLRSNKNMFGAGNVISMSWDFGDGNMTTSLDEWTQHTYLNTNSYNVKLTIAYNELTEARASSLSDLDLVNATSFDSIITDKIVQGTQTELNAISANNITEISIDSLGVYFGMQDSSFFRGTIPSVVYIAYYSTSCIDSIVKNNFIEVGPATAENLAPSDVYSFESENDLSTDSDWNIVNTSSTESDWSFNSGASSTWEQINGVAKHGSASIKVNGDNAAQGSHEIVSVAYNLSTLSEAAIKFSWSGAAVNYFPVNELDVHYSTNCGASWLPLGSLNKTNEDRGVTATGNLVDLNNPLAIDTTTLYGVANEGLHAASFKPETDKQWRDTVMTNSAIQGDNVRFKFEYIVNGKGNNFYLDNIQIGEKSALFSSEASTLNKLSIFPNPTNGETNIIIENLENMDVEVSLVNILGAEVKQLFNGVIVSNYQAINSDLSYLDRGVYFVKISSKGDVVLTDKLILNN